MNTDNPSEKLGGIPVDHDRLPRKEVGVTVGDTPITDQADRLLYLLDWTPNEDGTDTPSWEPVQAVETRICAEFERVLARVTMELQAERARAEKAEADEEIFRPRKVAMSTGG